jgi:hypothetical protein
MDGGLGFETVVVGEIKPYRAAAVYQSEAVSRLSFHENYAGAVRSCSSSVTVRRRGVFLSAMRAVSFVLFAMNKPEHKFIFLCGLHRSGTSPLFRILRGHPEISGFRDTGVPEDEGQHLQTVFPAANGFGGPGRFGFAPEAHLTEQSALVTAANQQKLFEEWSRYWDVSKRCLLEKSPPNLIRTRFLQALFPNSHFIVLLRHPIAACLATRKWADSSLESLFEHWLHCHKLFKIDRDHLKHVHVLKYEDLVRDTNAELAKIYRLLDLPPHPASALNPKGNDLYFNAWQQMSAEPTGAEVRRVVQRYEHEVRTHGYSLSESCSEALHAP